MAEAKVSCSERTQTSWLEAQIHAQLHKDGTKETTKGCKPLPRFPPTPSPPHLGKAPGSPTQPSWAQDGGMQPSWHVKGTAVPQASC